MINTGKAGSRSLALFFIQQFPGPGQQVIGGVGLMHKKRLFIKRITAIKMSRVAVCFNNF